MRRNTLRNWLRETSSRRLAVLWAAADAVRSAQVGDDVHLRGLIEISNHCVRQCAYCGLRAPNRALPRYRMTADEILDGARLACQLGYGTVVLQAGEDPHLTGAWVTALVRRLKAETPLAITLSLGERPRDELAAWRAAGADRYLLRFETSNAALFARIHPARNQAVIKRRTMLRWLRELDYEVGSGVMIGLPGQTYADLVNDLELFRALDLDMIGVGPYLPHPDTPLGRGADPSRAGADAQVPNDELMTYKVIALARLLCPRANIPSTTALATLNRAAGRMLGLQRGANVVMPNLTPDKFRACYAIYPAKACAYEEPRAYDALLRAQLQALGRGVDGGRGDALNWRARRPPAATSAPEDTRGGRSRCAPAD